MSANASVPNPGVSIREITSGDLEVFFAQHLDPSANYMAAFARVRDRESFFAHWDKIQADSAIVVRTIVYAGQVAGYVLVHGWFGDPEVSYWLGNEFWGKGIMSRALAAFLAEVGERPLYAHAAKDNLASLRVLQKCGFVIRGEGKSYANGRGAEVEEVILVLAG